jgi:hypothetical protein
MPLASSRQQPIIGRLDRQLPRTAVIRTLIETEPRPRASSATRQAATVAFVKPGRGSWPYHSMNSSSPRLYTRFVIGEETLSSTKPSTGADPPLCSLTLTRSFCAS